MGVLQTIPHDSDKGISGLAYVLLAHYGKDNLQIAIDASNNTTFTADVSLNTLFTKFVMTKETSGFTVTGTGTPTAGTTSYNHTLNLVFARNEALKANNVKVMGTSELVAIAVDRNGSAWCLGNDPNGALDMTSSTGASGVGPNDLGGQTIVLSGNQKYNESFV